MVKIYQPVDFGQKISMLVNIVRNSRFGSKLTKMSILDKIAENVDYTQNFRKMSIWVEIFKYLDFVINRTRELL